MWLLLVIFVISLDSRNFIFPFLGFNFFSLIVPITSNLTLKLSCPSLLTALQEYVPASSAATDGIISIPSLSMASLGKLEPSLSQVMVGAGKPDALQRNSTSSPSITVCKTELKTISGGSSGTVTRRNQNNLKSYFVNEEKQNKNLLQLQYHSLVLV